MHVQTRKRTIISGRPMLRDQVLDIVDSPMIGFRTSVQRVRLQAARMVQEAGERKEHLHGEPSNDFDLYCRRNSRRWGFTSVMPASRVTSSLDQFHRDAPRQAVSIARKSVLVETIVARFVCIFNLSGVQAVGAIKQCPTNIQAGMV